MSFWTKSKSAFQSFSISSQEFCFAMKKS
jgi:hypothetical protein